MKKLFLPLLVIVLVSLACRIGATPDLATPVATLAAVPATPVLPTAVPSAAPPALATPTPLAVPTATPVPLRPTPLVIPAGGEQPVQISGDFKFTNDIIETYYVEQAVALVDMYGFVTRNDEWEIPINGQVLGFLKLDAANKEGTYELQLPMLPEGTYFDFTRGGKLPGVQVFAVSYWPNLSGGPYSEGDDRTLGWPDYLASVVTDSGNKNEVVGGKLVVWAPDDKEQFPTGFGPDGLLFTQDDPLGPLPAGYSIIDLDQKPFGIERKLHPQVALYEPKDAAVKDFSKLSYSAAFQQMVDFLKKAYAFNGIAGKEPNWNQLSASLMPRIQQAEAKNDATAYFQALQDFSLAFKDGHVGIEGGDIGQQILAKGVASGYGLAIRELDDGRAMVVFVTNNGPAKAAGIEVGAVIQQVNGLPVKDAITATKIFSPESSDFGRRYEQARYLFRAPVGAEAKITFQPAAGAAKTVTLKAVNERQSFYVTSLYRNYDPTALPVEYRILDSGLGYVKVNSNYDDLNLIVRLFERALKTFTENQVKGLIIDMRLNSGGAPLGLAGFLTNKVITLGTVEYYSETTAKFEPNGKPDRFWPNQNQYHFARMALLVDQACFSACELESYGFSQVSGMAVIGMYPTGGVEAEVSRGQVKLPAGFTAQFPTGRFVLPDGSLFLEGQGVKPTVRVPITAENLLSQDDVVLKAAEDRLSK